MSNEKGLLEALMDFSFSHFVTPRIMRLLYALHLLLGLIVAIGAVLNGFQQSTAQGLLMLIFAVVGLFFWTFYVRVALEVLITVFRFGDHIAHIAGLSSRQ